ncbi:MAG TPA: transposase [Pyrinomonadaceae bacterium]
MGFADEVWWSRLAQPALHSWSEGDGLRLEELVGEKADPDPKALSCYGLLRAETGKVWLRFVAGRPVSAVTTQFLAWACERLAAEGKRALLLIWDNASWHISREVREWIRAHNRKAKREGGVRIIRCQLPTKSPWLNRIEPHWMHGKRAVVEPVRKLTAKELVGRVCGYYGCEEFPHLSK